MCRIGSMFCALPVEHVQETMRALPLQRLQSDADSVIGLARIRDAFVPVVGLSLVLTGTTSAPARFVLLRVEGRSVALAVDDVLQVVEIAPSSLDAMPDLLRDAAHDRIASIEQRDGQLVAVLKTARLVEDVVALDGPGAATP
jgi:purine-binding chemotaxis protein CheW